MTFLTFAQIQTKTDRYAGMFDAATSALPAILAKMQADAVATYGDGTTANLSLGDSTAINALGPADLAAVTTAAGPALATLLLAQKVAALSSYLQRFGGLAAGLPASVVDAASYARYTNGCPDPSPQGNGTGSSYAHLLHPSYAGLVAALTGSVSLLPPDVVFAPTGIVLARFHEASGGTSSVGAALMTAGPPPPAPILSGTAPYAPAKGWVVRCGNLQADGTITGNVPNGSMFVTLTGNNQAGTSVTWRGDAGTGLAAHGDELASTALKGTDGGANGGTAAPTDRLVRITGIVRDTTVSGGGTATQGDIDIITMQERASL